MSRGWNFEVVEGDVKRIFQVKVERLLGFFEGESDDEGGDESLVRGFFNRMNAANDEGTTSMEINIDKISDMEQQLAEEAAAAAIAVDAADVILDEDERHAEAVSRQARVLNANEASRVERLVEQNERQAAVVKEIISEVKPSPVAE